MVQKTATLNLNNGTAPIELPVLSGTMGPDVIDIRTLHKQSGMFTYDPGYLSTASNNSSITFIDGEKGILLYRGYPIEQLAMHCDFVDVCYLLMNGELPTPQQKASFDGAIKEHSMLHEQLVRFFNGFRRDAHPMAVMVGVVGALSAFYHEALNISDPAYRQQSAFRLIAKLPTIAAMAYKYNIGQPYVYQKSLELRGKFLAYDVFRTFRRIYHQPCDRSGIGSYFDFTCGSRTKCFNLNGAFSRF